MRIDLPSTSLLPLKVIVAGASTWIMKYFSEAYVLCVFLTLDIKELNDIRLISRPIHAPNHELQDTDTNTPLLK